MSEAVMSNSTLFNLEVGTCVPADMREIIMRTGRLNRLEKRFLPRIINNNPDLTHLKFGPTDLDPTMTSRVIEALGHNSTITSLDLSARRINDLDVARLCEMLNNNFSLLSLRLKYNTITCIGAASLAAALKINSTLTMLNLSGNNIGDEGRSSLRNALVWNQTLKCLKLRYFLDDVYIVSSEDESIVWKNWSLYDLLIQVIFKSFDSLF